MGAELSRTNENGKVVLTAKGNDFRYWEIEKLPIMKEWAKKYNLLVSSAEVIEDSKKKKVWSVSVNFDTVKDADNFTAKIKKVKEAYLQFEQLVRDTLPDTVESKETKEPKEPKETKTTKEKKVESDEAKRVKVVAI